MEIKHSVIPVILAGGFGSRISNLIEEQNRPKPLLEVNGRPFITFILDQLNDVGFEHVFISTGFMADKWYSILGQRYKNIYIDYFKECDPLGTGGALKYIAKEISIEPFDHILLINGDTYIENIQYDEILNLKSDFLISGVKNKEENRYGSITIDDENRVISFKEKSNDSNNLYTNAGNYFFDVEKINSYLNDFPTSFSLENDMLPGLCKDHEVSFYELLDTTFIDIGTEQSYEYFRNNI